MRDPVQKNENIEKIINKAEEKARLIFHIDIPIIFNKERLPEKPILEMMGIYDCYEDKITIYIKKLQQIASMFNLHLENIVTQVVCHEYGHAKQMRIFEEKQFCPWYIRKHKQCRIEIEGVEIPVKLEDINLINNSLQDFCINKLLYKYNILDFWSKKRIKDQKLSGSPELISFVRMMTLPMDITLYEFGELTNTEKEDIRLLITESIGENWDIVYNLMKLLDLKDVDIYLNVLQTLIENIFKQDVCFLPLNSETIFKRKYRPSFWNKSNYLVLNVVPRLNF